VVYESALATGGTKINSDYLRDASTAKQYLTSTYDYYYWRRS